MSLKRYRKQQCESVFALPLTLHKATLRFHKWGNEQVAKEGDWLVSNDGELYTVDGDSFAKTYEPVGPCRYRKTGSVWAELADADGVMLTKEGSSAYRKGDYLVFNEPDRGDGYPVAKNRFEQQYSLFAEEELMDADNYLATRVQDQIDWYEQRSAQNQSRFKNLQLLTIILGALIPLFTVISEPPLEHYIRFLIAAMGALMAMITASISLYQFQDKWVRYRSAAESLNREKYRYLTGSAPYVSEKADNFNVLVERCEAIMAGEFQAWVAANADNAELIPS